MARLQILELPAVEREDGRDETPFILVIDQASEDIAKTLNPQDEAAPYSTAMQRLTGLTLAEQIGARAVLVFEETVDIPVNETPVDPDGYPLKIRVEPDFETFREQVQDEIRSATARLAHVVRDARTAASPDTWSGRPTHPDGTPYSYSQIMANGWEPCDGCHTWGQWTLANPHDCPRTYIKGPTATVPPDA